MEVMPGGSSFITRAESLARIIVQTSAVAAVIAACVLLAQPWIGLTAGATFAVTAAFARWRFEPTATVVLFFAYSSVGVLLAVGGSLGGAPLWLAAMAGLVAGGLPWRRWNAPPAWRWPIILWLLGVALSWPIIAARETDFSFLTPRDAAGPVIGNALIYFAAGLWLDAALSFDAETIERRLARPLLASAIVSACAVFYQAFVDITWLSSEPWISLRRAPGLMGDANPMAVALGIWGPLAFAMLRVRPGGAVAAMMALGLWTGAWFTGARTVILQLVTGVFGVVKGALSGFSSRRLLAVAGIAIVAVVVVVTMVPSQYFVSGPLSRLSTTMPRQPREALYEVLWYRDGYGVAAVEAIRRHPWSGIGVGSYNHIQGDFHPLKGIIPVFADNAQNLWRHALAERGIFAFVAVVALTLSTGRLLLRRLRAAPELAATLKAAVIGLGLALVFGVPTQNAAIAVTAATIVAWLHASALPSLPLSAKRYSVALAVALTLAVAGAGMDAANAVADLRPAVRAARNGTFFAYGFGDAEVGADGSRGRAILGRAVAAVPITSKDYELRYWTRSTEAARFRVWKDRTLIIDELVPTGTISERVIEVPATSPGMLLDFQSDSANVIVAGRFR